ncbi:hypothetical protein PUN28_015347 [Cardiocondyla obscurior]|uniref:Uncharacterized protein n=1 Tax=Cardiocondyla obscurior TaxID=286306 RepID=A0AAW2ESI8_9HYME
MIYHTYPPHRGSKHHAKHHAKEKRHHHHHTLHHQHHRAHVVSRRSKEHSTEEKERVSQFKLLEVSLIGRPRRAKVTVRKSPSGFVAAAESRVHGGFHPRGRNLSMRARSISMHVALRRAGRAV